MADVFTKTKRSEVMSKIRSRGNRDTELRMISIFREHHITGWRRNVPLAGKPDFVFPKRKLALFIDGCFWHGCPIHFVRPKTNCNFWDAKIGRNRQRDREVRQLLRKKGWQVLRIWEHDLSRKRVPRTIARMRYVLSNI